MAQLLPPSFACLWRDPDPTLPCQRIFIETKPLITHLYDDHLHQLQPVILEGKKRWPCRWSNCDKTFSSKSYLENHLSQHKDDFGISEYACGSCQPKQKFNTALKLFEHNNQMHTVDDDQTPDPRNTQFAEPVLPPHRSQSPPHPPTYERTIRNLPTQSTESSSITSSCEWIIDGKTCDRAQAPAQLLQHVSSDHLVHRSQGSTKWKCLWSNCKSIYTERTLLLTHISQTHLKTSLHFCAPCQVNFPTPSTLALHRRNHAIIDHKQHKEEKIVEPSCKFCQPSLPKPITTSYSSSSNPYSLPAPIPTASTSSASIAAPPPLRTSYRAMPSQDGPLSSSSSPLPPYPRGYYSK